MYKKIRRIAAAVFFVGITFLLTGINWHVGGALGWMADLQFLPALLALNLGVVLALVLLTLVFGRIYCSVICPLGVFQDLAARLGRVVKRRRGNRKPYSYSKEKKWLRYGVWVLFVIALLAGVQVFVAMLAPYSAWGRIVGSIFQPKSWPVIAVAAGTFLIVGTLAFMNGRTWCNTICPVGTTLSFFSRFAMFRPMIDASKCKNCKVCEHNCKASCINVDEKKIDYSRCVDCFNCLDGCALGAMKYRFAWGGKASGKGKADAANGPEKSVSAERSGVNDAQKAASTSRREFLAGAALVAGTALHAQTQKLDGGKAPIVPKTAPKRRTRITPPGSQSAENLYSKCTACQLCISNCPNDVLHPGTDIEHFMQPFSSYEKGWCRPECNSCSQVCPSGAILPLTREEKTAVSIGRAVWHRGRCVPVREGQSCGNCARHCPTGAIYMVPMNPEDPDSLKIPAVDESKCIGCGACEYVCPVRPRSAISVEGYEVHINR